MEIVQKTVAIWLRVSTEDQVRGDSPEHHEKRARYYAESKGWVVKEVYRLDAVSGKSVMDNPETKRMLEDVRSGKITGLIFSKLARLARNTKELLEFAEIFRQYNSDLISLQESIDTSTPAGRLFYTMIAAMAQWEREEIAERVAASVPVRARLGKPLGGQAPFGYRFDENKKLVPDDREAHIRKHLYELFLEHRRKKTVARLLNEAGYRTRNGSRFSDTTVSRLLRDPVAKGLRRANYTHSTDKNKKWTLKPQSEWIFTEVAPIVSEKLWDECNCILDEQEKNHKKPAKKAANLFTGFVYCHCGNKMYVPSSSPKYTCYSCRNKISSEDLEEIYHSQLTGFFQSPDEIIKILQDADSSIQLKEGLLQSLLSEQKKIKQEMDGLVRLYLDESIPKEGFNRHYRPLEERLGQVEGEIPLLQGEIDFLKIQLYSSDHILNEARSMYDRWHEFSFEEKRKTIESITEKIIVGKGDISFKFQYALSGKLPSESQRNLKGS